MQTNRISKPHQARIGTPASSNRARLLTQRGNVPSSYVHRSSGHIPVVNQRVLDVMEKTAGLAHDALVQLRDHQNIFNKVPLSDLDPRMKLIDLVNAIGHFNIEFTSRLSQIKPLLEDPKSLAGVMMMPTLFHSLILWRFVDNLLKKHSTSSRLWKPLAMDAVGNVPGSHMVPDFVYNPAATSFERDLQGLVSEIELLLREGSSITRKPIDPSFRSDLELHARGARNFMNARPRDATNNLYQSPNNQLNVHFIYHCGKLFCELVRQWNPEGN